MLKILVHGKINIIVYLIMSHFALQKLMNLYLESVITWIRQGEIESKY